MVHFMSLIMKFQCNDYIQSFQKYSVLFDGAILVQNPGMEVNIKLLCLIKVN